MRAALFAAVLAAACKPSVTFHCSDSAQCTLGATLGTCEPAGYCSFPDSSCASQRRFDETAGSDLADTCVAGQPGCEDFASHLYSACALTAPDVVTFDAATYTYDTDSDALAEQGGSAVAHGSIAFTQADGSRVRALSLAQLSLPAGAALRVGGSLPLILASWADASVDGDIIVAPSATDCAAAAGSDGGGGGGGGGNQGFGGTGGGDDPVAGGTGGSTIATPTTVRGGCAGGPSGAPAHAAGGAGGGAILISANGALTIGGDVQAGGAGGAAGGGGGGAGGLVALDATSIALTGILSATGGGGGGAQSAGAAGSGSNAAAGGDATDCAPAGGSGAAQQIDGASVGSNSTCGGAGGGGADGYILTFASVQLGSGAVAVPATTPQ